jgi:hypothetical protein
MAMAALVTGTAVCGSGDNVRAIATASKQYRAKLIEASRMLGEMRENAVLRRQAAASMKRYSDR